MAQWNENTVPKCDVGKCSDEDMGWNMCDGVLDDWEYSEEDDSYWIPQGWYEVCDYSPDDYSYFTITDKVIAWMKLPKPFNKKLKQLSEIELPKTLNPEVVK